MSGEQFQPRILGFLCNWCSYAGADLSGVSRFQYPPNLRVIRVMCSGRVDPVLVFEAFGKGIDGVAVLGCHPGDCHYLTGNYIARRKMALVGKVLDRVGIGRDRFILDWISAAEGQQFAALVTKFTETIRERGPISESVPDLTAKAALGTNIVTSIRMRWLVGKEEELLERGNVYGERIDPAEYNALIDRNIDSEYERQLIKAQLLGDPKTIDDVAGAVGLDKRRVFKYVTELENAGAVVLEGFDGNVPRYVMTCGAASAREGGEGQ
jgi:F420-non-reducing hydrogenase iron-sulfur subunit